MGNGRGLPYFPFYPDDFVSDGAVEAMDTEQVGAYTLLLCKAWREFPAGSVPDDDAVLARWARMTPARWRKAKPAVLRPWTLKEGRWHQKRMQVEYGRLLIRSERARGAVEQRWEKIRGLRTNSAGTGSAVPSDSVRNTDVERPHYHPDPDPEPYPEAEPHPEPGATTTTNRSSRALRGGDRGGAEPDGDAIDLEWQQALESAIADVSLLGKKDLAFLRRLCEKKPRLEPKIIRDELLRFQREMKAETA